MTLSAWVLAGFCGLSLAAVGGPVAFAHFDAGIVFGVCFAWLRWRGSARRLGGTA